jgi:hypothetical protein
MGNDKPSFILGAEVCAFRLVYSCVYDLEVIMEGKRAPESLRHSAKNLQVFLREASI